METSTKNYENLHAKYSALLMKPLETPNFWAGVINNQTKWYAYCMELLAFCSECGAISSNTAKELADSAKEEIAKIAGYCIYEGNLELQHGHRQEGETWFETAIKIYTLIPDWKDSGEKITECKRNLQPVQISRKAASPSGCRRIAAILIFAASVVIAAAAAANVFLPMLLNSN